MRQGPSGDREAHRKQLAERAPPVAQLVLVRRRHLGERAVEALGGEDRVVAEAAPAAGWVDQRCRQ